MTPKIILICKGGVIQKIIANTEVEVVALDYDIFMDVTPNDDEHYEDRTYPTLVSKNFDEVEKECREEWEKEYQKAIQ